MKYIDYPTKTKKNSFSLWIQGPSALLVKKEKWCIPRSGYYLRPPKTRKSLITNLLSPNFRNRLTSELQRAPHSRTDCDFEKLIPPRSETNDQRHQRGRRNLYGIIRNDEPGNVGVYPTKCSSFARRNYEKLCPINLSSLAMQLNQ